MEDPQRLAEISKARPRHNKILVLRLALHGHIQEHHRFQLAAFWNSYTA
jgi:hypothetical protein